MSRIRLSLPTKRLIKLSAIGLALLLLPKRSSPNASVIDADAKADSKPNANAKFEPKPSSAKPVDDSAI